MSVARHGFPLVLAAPSGAGKTSIARQLVTRRPDAVFSVSATTRTARPRERSGRDYHFVTDADFDRMVEAGDLAEWATVHGHRYGTPKASLDAALQRGEIVVLDVDVQGAGQIREAYSDAVLVFVLPPSARELVRRLKGRHSEAEAEVRRRLSNARGELDVARTFDYVVVNENLDAAVAAVMCIADAERLRVRRAADLDATLARLDSQIGAWLERSQ